MRGRVHCQTRLFQARRPTILTATLHRRNHEALHFPLGVCLSVKELRLTSTARAIRFREASKVSAERFRWKAP